MLSVLEINNENRFLCLYRGFLRICEDKEIITDLPLDMLMAVIVTGHGISFSEGILTELAKRNIPVVFCGSNYHPVGILNSIEGNCRQTEIMLKQINMTVPFKKNIWKIIIEQKIKNQAKVLEKFGINADDLKQIANRVLSGDTTNCESAASRIYFPKLFGKNFLRSNLEIAINSFLNYGYAIIRAALARFIVASGLLPAFGIHHRNMLNAFCLVDDIMEAYRPVVDFKVKELISGKANLDIKLGVEEKKELAGLLEKSVKTKEGISPLRICMQKTIWSFVDSLKTKKPIIIFEKNII